MAISSWKIKYLDIRAKLLRATDVAYRLGYEKGLKEGQMEAQMQMQQQQAEQQAQMQAMQAQGGGEVPPEMMEEGGGAPQEQLSPEMMEEQGQDQVMPPMDDQDVSELDQNIAELESLVAKGEKPSVVELRKAVEKISNITKSAKQKKKDPTAQKKLVDNILSKWEKDIKEEATDDIVDSLRKQGFDLD